MIEERATVVEVRGPDVLVTAERSSTCGQCAARRGCGTSALADYLARRQPLLLVENTLDARVGDEVRLALDEGALLTGSMLVYAVPLGVMLLGAATGDRLAAGVGGSPDGFALVGAIIGFALGGLWTRWRLRSALLRRRVRPAMLEVNGAGGVRRAAPATLPTDTP